MFKTKDILAATGGKLVWGSKNFAFTSISTDTRKISKGQLFVPLVGKRFDGHNFISQAVSKGASGVLVARSIGRAKSGTIVIKVGDTEKALQDIAKLHRQKFKIPVIGITGSSGKTTTKDMTAAIICREKKVLKSEGNLNNEIGVPLTLLKLNKTHEAAVIEMAMQRAGEIDELAEITLPNIAVITNIGEAHMEFFKSKKMIAKVKAEILNYLGKGDTAVLNADDPYFAFLKKKARTGRMITFGLSNKAGVRAENIEKIHGGMSFIIKTRFKNIPVTLPLPGVHNIYNALASAAACLSAGIKPSSIQKGLSRFRPPAKRMNITDRFGIRVIDDTYNANPSSMKAAISVLSEEGSVTGKGPSRKIAVLGDMLELGKASKKSHVEIGRFAARKRIDLLITKGLLSRDIAGGARSAGLRSVRETRSNEDAIKILKKIIKQNDVLLIKGSRGMKMEEIAENILK